MNGRHTHAPWSVGPTRQWGAGHNYHCEVWLQAGPPGNQGNCLGTIVSGGPGGESRQREDVQATAAHVVRCINERDDLLAVLDQVRNGLARIQLAELDTTTAAADKARDMARIARVLINDIRKVITA